MAGEVEAAWCAQHRRAGFACGRQILACGALSFLRVGASFRLCVLPLLLFVVQLVCGLASLLAVAPPLLRGGDQHRGVQLLTIVAAHRSSPRLRLMSAMRSGRNRDPSPRTRSRRSSRACRAASAFAASCAVPVCCGPSPSGVLSGGGVWARYSPACPRV